MIEKLAIMPKYEAYKDSGVKWIGEIPAHWGSTSSKRLLEMPITDGPHSTPQLFDEGIPFISAEAIKNGVINFDSKRGYISEKDYQEFSRKYIPQRNDVYMVKSGATTGRVAKVETDEKFTIWSPLAVFRSKQSTLQSSFLYYFLSSPSFQKGIELSWSFGTQQNIGMGVLGNLPVCYPPLSEQTAIAAFLDRKIVQIDQAVEIKEKQIALLKERKQVLIQNAITRGLNPDAPVQNSGVEWIGEIPEHWGIKRLKYVVKILKRIAGKEGYDVLSITQQGIKIKDIESGEGQLAMDYSNYQFLFHGEFAMNHMDLLTGYVDISQFDGVVSPDYRVFQNVSSKVDDRYLLAIFQVGYKQKIFYRYGQGVSLLGRWRFPVDNFNNFLIPIPPLDEQTAIVSHIETESAKIDKAIAIQQQQIDKLKEYKATLINSAVTGKIKVPDFVEGSSTEFAKASVPEAIEGELVEDSMA